MTAFEFDAACSYVYRVWENERSAKRLEMQLRGFAAMLGGDPGEPDGGPDLEDLEDSVP